MLFRRTAAFCAAFLIATAMTGCGSLPFIGNNSADTDTASSEAEDVREDAEETAGAAGEAADAAADNSSESADTVTDDSGESADAVIDDSGESADAAADESSESGETEAAGTAVPDLTLKIDSTLQWLRLCLIVYPF